MFRFDQFCELANVSPAVNIAGLSVADRSERLESVARLYLQTFPCAPPIQRLHARAQCNPARSDAQASIRCLIKRNQRRWILNN